MTRINKFYIGSFILSINRALTINGCYKKEKGLCKKLFAVFVPAGTWHNIINIGDQPLKIYTIYAPPHHLHGTVQTTKAQADREEH